MSRETPPVLQPLSEEEKAKIVKDYLPKMKLWVMKAKGTLPESVDADDLYSAASMGLIECLERFDKSRNVSFSTFAELRIRGSIVDALRSLDTLPRHIRTNIKQLEKISVALATKLGRKPLVSELVEHTEFSEETVYRLLDLQETDKVLSLNDTVGNDDSNLIDFIDSATLSPEDELLKSKLVEHLSSEIDSLSEKEKMVVSLYYFEDLTMKEVAEIIGITESRISQIHTQAISKLKRRLKSLYE